MFLDMFMEFEPTERTLFIQSIKNICRMLDYLPAQAEGEGDENELSIYKRILHIINGLLRLPTLTKTQYNQLYLLFKDETYRSPWNRDGLSYHLLKDLCMMLPINDEIKNLVQGEIKLTIYQEIAMIMEIKN